MVAILVVITVVAFIAADYFLRYRKQGMVVQGAGALGLVADPVLGNEYDPTDWPAGVFVAPGHTWLSIEVDGDVKVGAGSLAAWVLDRTPQIELLRQGTKLAVGDKLAVLKSGDREITLRSPVEGTICKVNQQIETSHKDLTRGWLYEVTPTSLSDDLKRMHIGDKARLWMQGEMVRLRDLMAAIQGRYEGELPQMADGGAPIQGLARVLDGPVWQELAEAMFSSADKPADLNT